MERLTPIVLLLFALAGVATGCLPDMADDKAVAAHLASQQDAAGAEISGDAAGGADSEGDASGADADHSDTQASDTTGDTAGDAGGDVDTAGDGGDTASSDGGPIPCKSAGDCGALAGSQVCHEAACVSGSCALVAVGAGAACTVTDVTLQPCQQSTCNDKGACVVGTAPDGAACDADGTGCTQGDSCQSGACKAGPAVTCPAGANPCATPTCSADGADAYVCSPVFKGKGVPCDDGKFCTIDETCDGGGGCVGLPNPCTQVAGPCATGSCDALTGSCDATPKAKGAACDNDACSVGGTCDGEGKCDGVKPKCDDGNACTADSCDPKAAGQCSSSAITGACDDGDACTTGESCDAKGVCAGGKPSLYNLLYSASSGAKSERTVALADGSVVLLGTRLSQPWAIRIGANGTLAWQVSGKFVGAWTAGVALSDGGVLLVGSKGVLAAKKPVVSRINSGGSLVGTWDIAISGVGEARGAAIWGKDQVLVTVNQDVGVGAGSYVRAVGYGWSVATSSVTTKHFEVGAKGNSKELYDGVVEPDSAGGRIVLVGSEETKTSYDGWLYRVDTKTGLFKGETNINASDTDILYAVDLRPGGGYVAAGSSDAKAGQSEAWVVAVDAKLQVSWQARYSTKDGAWINDVVALPSGGVWAAGLVATSKAGFGKRPWDGLLWRLNPWGGSELVQAYGSAGVDQMFFGMAVHGDGVLAAGHESTGLTSTAWALRVDPWGNETCGKSGACVTKKLADCSDGKACTTDLCSAQKGCTAADKSKGAACADGKVCSGAKTLKCQ